MPNGQPFILGRIILLILRNCFDFMLHKIYDGFFSETRQILQT